MTKTSYTRPGVQGAVLLVNLVTNDEENASTAWRNVESNYSKMIIEKGGTKLKILDEYRECLAKSLKEKIESGTECFIGQAELLKLVEWKFAKGKPRLALMKYLNANSEKEVKHFSLRAFSRIQILNKDKDNRDNIKGSIGSLCELEAVGPATTSAIHYLILPDLFISRMEICERETEACLNEISNANSEKQVKDSSLRAFSGIQELNKDSHDNIKGSINSLCELKGVGPATASAILCMVRPDLISFMDDEVIECLYDGKRGYTYKIYEKVNQRCTELANALGDDWTPW
eukprot:CAMPEP_0197841474 /NCGR_PEP_ID=MMETSP1437-20131217/46202_1 /TAXON_ID=49252 ORGANISM="Eucampia antarctica, Strain CCMP1452" /NCGR_SAMPLE_ID=MMETSP1437 /ASSEMBLY_ACC=CAM_ASM_001096 /LENGTH=288 /DNA_ID=CAMNT_0043451239 /DNA_START=13 /DNA_END=877 /DNA_ORIENTATION=-